MTEGSCTSPWWVPLFVLGLALLLFLSGITTSVKQLLEDLSKRRLGRVIEDVAFVWLCLVFALLVLGAIVSPGTGKCPGADDYMRATFMVSLSARQLPLQWTVM